MLSDFSRRLKTVRSNLKKLALSALIVPTGDPHASEYPPEHWKLRHHLSPFSGSAGTLVITANATALWTDSRYWNQAERQLEGCNTILMKIGEDSTPTPAEWLIGQLKKDSVVGIDGSSVTWKEFDCISEKLALNSIALQDATSFCDTLWETRPAISCSPVFQFMDNQASTAEKLKRVRENLQKHQASAHFVSSLDSIAWITNLRGNDIAYTPVFLAYLWIDAKNAIIFINPDKLSTDITATLENQSITVMPYENITTFLRDVTPGESVLLDKSKTSACFIDALEHANIIDESSPVDTMKAIKSASELSALRETMITDGVAITELCAWIQNRIYYDIPTTEIDISDELLRLRQLSPSFIEPSFETIAAFGANAAECHYTPAREGSSLITRGSLLLIDSGGQYQGGTTDITRTMAIGETTREMKRDFTAVLKGHIALATATFPDGVYGSQLDTLARTPLWEIGADYGHGTGHGVGFTLGVHEGPVHISPRSKCNLETRVRKGLVLSNEPGVYRSGLWGVRTENLVTPVDSTYDGFLTFETLTLAAIDTRLIDTSMMTPSEIRWVNTYHRVVYERLNKYLSNRAKDWLKRATEPV